MRMRKCPSTKPLKLKEVPKVVTPKITIPYNLIFLPEEKSKRKK